MQRLKHRKSKPDLALPSCLSYEDMLEIAAEREKETAGTEYSDSQVASIRDHALDS
jgi:hypothetical protein